MTKALESIVEETKTYPIMTQADNDSEFTIDSNAFVTHIAVCFLFFLPKHHKETFWAPTAAQTPILNLKIKPQ